MTEGINEASGKGTCHCLMDGSILPHILHGKSVAIIPHRQTFIIRAPGITIGMR